MSTNVNPATTKFAPSKREAVAAFEFSVLCFDGVDKGREPACPLVVRHTHKQLEQLR